MEFEYGNEYARWEPDSPQDWIRKDPLAKHLSVGNSWERGMGLVLSAWRRLPIHLRHQAWEEREIAAELFVQIHERDGITGLKSTGVGMRSIGGRRKLVGIYVFDRQSFVEPAQEIARYDLPSTISYQTLTKGGRQDQVEMVVEYEPPNWLLGTVPQNQFHLVSTPPPPTLWPVVQAGDSIVGKTPPGFLVNGTLTAIVSSANNYTPLLLGAQHVLGDRGANVHVNAPTLTRVGQVSDSDAQLDASIVKLDNPWSVDYRVKQVNLVPAAPIFPYTDMAVQFAGGKSGHQTGWIDVVNSIPYGTHSVGIIPHFRVSITAQPGDSGALLLSGHAQQSPIDPRRAAYMDPRLVDALTAAMLGMLVAGPSSNPSATTRPQAYITPILDILPRFNLQPWVR